MPTPAAHAFALAFATMTSTTEHPMRWGAAFLALWRLARDNDDTVQVFRIVNALRGRSDLRNVARMRRSAIGRASSGGPKINAASLRSSSVLSSE